MDQFEQQRFSELFDRLAPAVLAYLLRRADRTTAEDALSETFLVAWRRRRELPEEPLPWLYGVARRALLNQRRSGGRQVALAGRLAERESDVLEEPEGREQFDWVLSALAQLSEEDQEVLRLDVWEELSRVEAAQVLGCRPATYGVRLHRARGRLRLIIDAQRAAPAPAPVFTEPRT